MNTVEEQVEKAVDWIEALCDNSFDQGFNRMIDKNGGFCCLQVGKYVNNLGGGEEDLEYALSVEETEEVGLKTYNSQDYLSELNDVDGFSHDRIGKELLSNLKFFFKKEVAEGIAEHFWG
jgi:hypothetical protein